MKKRIIIRIAAGVVLAGAAWYVYKVRSYLLMEDKDGVKENVSALPHSDTRNRNPIGDTYVESHDNNGVSDTGSVS